MWTQYCTNCKVDVLLQTEPFWSAKGAEDLKRINTFLYRLALLRVGLLPAFVALVWGLYKVWGQHEVFLLVLMLAYAVLMTVLWSISRSEIRKVGALYRVLFEMLIERTVLTERMNAAAFIGLPIFVVLNCCVLGQPEEAMNWFYGLFLAVTVMANFIYVLVKSAQVSPYWMEDVIEKHI